MKDPVTKEPISPVTSVDSVYLSNGKPLSNYLNMTHYPIGSLIQSTCKQRDAGLHLADGGELAIGGSYDDFCQYVISHQEDFPTTDLATYNAEIAEYGQCGKYVISGTYIKLPKITKMTESANNSTELGQSVKAGLPNIKGSFVSMYTIAKDNNYDGVGAIETPYNATSGYYGGSTSSSEWGYGFNFNANKSNEIYNDETNTVQPQTTKYYYYVVISNTVKTDIEVNIDNIATDLNNKIDKDLGNINPEDLDKLKNKFGLEYAVYEANTINTEKGSIKIHKYGRICILNVWDAKMNQNINPYSGLDIVTDIPVPFRPAETYVANFGAEGNGNQSLAYIHNNGILAIGSWGTNINSGKHLTFQIVYISQE
jgi:hypothetical protein